MGVIAEQSTREDAERIATLVGEIEKIIHELTTYNLPSSQAYSVKPSIDAILAGLRSVRGRATLIKERFRAQQGG